MSSEDPLINHCPWTAEEDNNLRLIIEEKGFTDWLDIAVSLGTNRTPFQCLARYQRSLNADVMRKEWTKEEDDQLRAAVDLYGEKDWQSVANALEGRTGTQCSNRSVPLTFMYKIICISFILVRSVVSRASLFGRKV